MLAVMTTVTFYLITAYMPTYGSNVLHLSTTSSMLVTLIVGISNFLLLPTMGAVSDKVGRRPMLLISSGVALLTAYPVLAWLVTAPSFGRLLAAALWFSLIFGSYNGSMVSFPAPKSCRPTCAFPVSHSRTALLRESSAVSRQRSRLG